MEIECVLFPACGTLIHKCITATSPVSPNGHIAWWVQWLEQRQAGVMTPGFYFQVMEWKEVKWVTTKAAVDLKHEEISSVLQALRQKLTCKRYCLNLKMTWLKNPHLNDLAVDGITISKKFVPKCNG